MRRSFSAAPGPRHVFLVALVLLSLSAPALLLPGKSSAAQASPRAASTAEGSAKADTSTEAQKLTRAAIKADATPVAVELTGIDTLGAKVALRLKEEFNAGTLFSLNDKDVPKLLVLLSTAAEFPSRPEVGSVYSVVWVYSERSSVLSNYLAHEVGVVTSEGAADLAARLAERTSGLAAKHSYIFSR